MKHVQCIGPSRVNSQPLRKRSVCRFGRLGGKRSSPFVSNRYRWLNNSRRLGFHELSIRVKAEPESGEENDKQADSSPFAQIPNPFGNKSDKKKEDPDKNGGDNPFSKLGEVLGEVYGATASLAAKPIAALAEKAAQEVLKEKEGEKKPATPPETADKIKQTVAEIEAEKIAKDLRDQDKKSAPSDPISTVRETLAGGYGALATAFAGPFLDMAKKGMEEIQKQKQEAQDEIPEQEPEKDSEVKDSEPEPEEEPEDEKAAVYAQVAVPSEDDLAAEDGNGDGGPPEEENGVGSGEIDTKEQPKGFGSVTKNVTQSGKLSRKERKKQKREKKRENRKQQKQSQEKQDEQQEPSKAVNDEIEEPALASEDPDKDGDDDVDVNGLGGGDDEEQKAAEILAVQAASVTDPEAPPSPPDSDDLSGGQEVGDGMDVTDDVKDEVDAKLGSGEPPEPGESENVDIITGEPIEGEEQPDAGKEENGSQEEGGDLEEGKEKEESEATEGVSNVEEAGDKVPEILGDGTELGQMGDARQVLDGLNGEDDEEDEEEEQKDAGEVDTEGQTSDDATATAQVEDQVSKMELGDASIASRGSELAGFPSVQSWTGSAEEDGPSTMDHMDDEVTAKEKEEEVDAESPTQPEEGVEQTGDSEPVSELEGDAVSSDETESEPAEHPSVDALMGDNDDQEPNEESVVDAEEQEDEGDLEESDKTAVLNTELQVPGAPPGDSDDEAIDADEQSFLEPFDSEDADELEASEYKVVDDDDVRDEDLLSLSEQDKREFLKRALKAAKEAEQGLDELIEEETSEPSSTGKPGPLQNREGLASKTILTRPKDNRPVKVARPPPSDDIDMILQALPPPVGGRKGLDYIKNYAENMRGRLSTSRPSDGSSGNGDQAGSRPYFSPPEFLQAAKRRGVSVDSVGGDSVLRTEKMQEIGTMWWKDTEGDGGDDGGNGGNGGGGGGSGGEGSDSSGDREWWLQVIASLVTMTVVVFFTLLALTSTPKKKPARRAS